MSISFIRIKNRVHLNDCSFETLLSLEKRLERRVEQMSVFCPRTGHISGTVHGKQPGTEHLVAFSQTFKVCRTLLKRSLISRSKASSSHWVCSSSRVEFQITRLSTVIETRQLLAVSRNGAGPPPPSKFPSVSGKLHGIQSTNWDLKMLSTMLINSNMQNSRNKASNLL